RLVPTCSLDYLNPRFPHRRLLIPRSLGSFQFSSPSRAVARALLTPTAAWATPPESLPARGARPRYGTMRCAERSVFHHGPPKVATIAPSAMSRNGSCNFAPPSSTGSQIPTRSHRSAATGPKGGAASATTLAQARSCASTASILAGPTLGVRRDVNTCWRMRLRLVDG